jgi:hypothetical protein
VHKRRRPCRGCALRRTPAVAVVARTWWSRAMMQEPPTTIARIFQPQLLHPDRPHAAMTATPALQSHVIVHVRTCSRYSGCVAFLVIVASRWGIYQSTAHHSSSSSSSSTPRRGRPRFRPAAACGVGASPAGATPLVAPATSSVRLIFFSSSSSSSSSP